MLCIPGGVEEVVIKSHHTVCTPGTICQQITPGKTGEVSLLKEVVMHASPVSKKETRDRNKKQDSDKVIVNKAK